MKRTTKDMLSKSVIVKGLFPTNIAFSPEEADVFLDYVIDESVLKGNARIVKMKQHEKTIRGMDFASGTRILKPVAQFTGGTTMLLESELTYGKVTLSTKKVRGCVPIYDDDLEDNIEGESFEDHLMRMIAKKMAMELDEGYFMSAAAPDEASQLDLLDVWDGWLRQILGKTWLGKTANILTATTDRYVSHWNDTTKLWEFKFGAMKKALPTKYRKDMSKFRFFVNPGVAEDFTQVLASRGTVLGDQVILKQMKLNYAGSPIVQCPLFSETEGVPVSGGGDTTVDANSLKNQKVLNVAATDNFSEGDKIVIGTRSDATYAYKHEVHTIDTIQAGTSLTLIDNLVYDQLAADYAAAGAPVKEVTLDGTHIIFTRWNNFVIAIQRIMKMETERDAANECTLFYFSTRVDTQIDNPEEVVIYKNLKIRA